MSEAKQSKIDFEVWEYILPALPMIAEVSAKGFEERGKICEVCRFLCWDRRI